MKKSKRLFAILLALAMIVTFMPAMAFADDVDEGGDPWADIEFDEMEGSDRLYSDGTNEYSYVLKDVPDGAAVKAGLFCLADEDGDWIGIDDYCVISGNTATITLSGSNVKALGADDGNWWLVSLSCVGDDGTPYWAASCAFEFREAREPEYNIERDRDMLPGWGESIDSTNQVWADCAEYPEFDGEYEIKNVTVIAGEDLLKNGVEADGDGWYFEIKDLEEFDEIKGTVTFKVEYLDLDNTQQEYTFNINVSAASYYVDLNSEDNVWRTLPGQSINLYAGGHKSWIDLEGGGDPYKETDEGLVYKWEITNGSEFASLTVDKDDQRKAVLKFKDIPSGYDGYYNGEVDVKVSLYDPKNEPGKIRDSREEDCYVEQDYYQIEPTELELDPGEETTIQPVLYHYEYGKDRTVVDDADFSFDDNDSFEVVKKGNKYEITRLDNCSTELRLRAFFKNDDGDDDDVDVAYWFDDYWIDLGDSEIVIENEGAVNTDYNNWSLFTDQRTDNAIAVSLNNSEGEIDSENYNLTIYRYDWDEEKQEDIETEVENGELAIPDDESSAHFRIEASAAEGSYYSGGTDCWLDLYYGKSFDAANLGFVDENDEPLGPHDGSHPMTDYYWVVAGTTPTTVLTINDEFVSNDKYTVSYYRGDYWWADGDPEVFFNDKNKVNGFPTEEGVYTALAEPNEDSGFEGINDRSRVVLMSAAEKKALESAEKEINESGILELIGKINVYNYPYGFNADAVASARKAYDKLSKTAKDLVPDYMYVNLLAGEFINTVNAIDAKNPDEAMTKEAREKYESIKKIAGDDKDWMETLAPKTLVSKLEDAEQAIKDAADAKKKAEEEAAAKAAAEAAAEAARQGVVDKAVAKVKISKPVAAKKAVTVKWNKLSSKDKKKASNIEIWICPNKGFSAADTKIVTVGKGKASKKIKGLKAKTKYYVKVRAIKKVGGVKHYKAWSKVKSVKTK